MPRMRLEMPMKRQEKIEIPGFSPIFESVKCAKCGENVMISKAIKRGGEYFLNLLILALSSRSPSFTEDAA